jgi:CspA family cold shock protein
MTNIRGGTFKCWIAAKGFGFLNDDETGEGVFVHISALGRIGLNELTHGQRFSYELKYTGKASKAAVNLKLLSDDEQAAA